MSNTNPTPSAAAMAAVVEYQRDSGRRLYSHLCPHTAEEIALIIDKHFAAQREATYSYQVLVFEPALTHSVWQDLGCDESMSHAEILKLLRAGVDSKEYVGWRTITIHKEVVGRDSIAPPRALHSGSSTSVAKEGGAS